MISLLTFPILLFLLANIVTLPLPFNQYSYMLARNKIRQNDQVVQRKNSLNGKERIVSLYLEWLRTIEFVQTCAYFYPARPIETEVQNITNSSLYKFLMLLPKGGNLHIHESQILDRRLLLESIQNSTDYELLYICDQDSCTTNKYFLSYFLPSNVPQGWTKVKDSNWTIPEIVKKTTLIGILNDLNSSVYATDTAARWAVANHQSVFNFYDDVLRYNSTRFNYMKMVLDNALEENIQLLEFRRNFFGTLFYFDTNGTKIVINATDELNMLMQFKNDYIERNPKLIDFIFLMHSLRFKSKEQIRNEIDQFISLQKMYPDFIRGYDMVGEEDQGHTLLFHSDSLIQAFNYSQNSNGSFNLFFHAGETNWPEEYVPSNNGDGVGTSENIYDALVLRTHRIGHGLSLAKRPDVYNYIRDHQIAIEICPASNQILGYVADLRNHPGIIYHRSGIPIVLAGDDPGSFGYNQLTVDFYLATMAWGLNLADLKQFAWNSIQYSSIPESRKKDGFMKWKIEWNLFIDSAYELTCNNQTFHDVAVNISNLLPSYGPHDVSINVTIFGSGFESAICKTVTCRFGDTETNGILVDLNEIICPTPVMNGNFATVPVSLVINHTIITTDFSYTFVLPFPILDDDSLITATPPSKVARVTNSNQILITSVVTLVLSLTI